MNKKKSRPAPTRFQDNRHQRGRNVTAHGIYNNSFFMHAATSFVGNLVQIQTLSGSIYEGIFRTFSPNFEVALELAHCIKNNKNLSDDTKNLPNYMIFPPNHIVNISAKDIDFDYATGGTFQTDSAISAKCNGSRQEEKELEPWDPHSGTVNGEIDLELDGNANGWDANEMFNKNAEMFNVKTTFDDSLSDYTVQIEIKDSQEFKEAEAKAERLAQEIENDPSCRERLDLENGDEETLFASVDRVTNNSTTNTEIQTTQQVNIDKSIQQIASPPPINSNTSNVNIQQSSVQHSLQQQQQQPQQQQHHQQTQQQSVHQPQQHQSIQSQHTYQIHPHQQATHQQLQHQQQQQQQQQQQTQQIQNQQQQIQHSSQSQNQIHQQQQTLSQIQSQSQTNQPQPQQQPNINMSKSSNAMDKYVLPSKRKNMQAPTKLTRGGSSSNNNNNGPMSQHISHSNTKNNNFQSMPMQNPNSYVMNPGYTHVHGGSQYRHSSNVTQSKMNGDGSSNNANVKPLPQRTIRQYSSQTNNHSYIEQQSGPNSVNKHSVHNQHHVSHQQVSNNLQEQNPQNSHLPHSTHHNSIQSSNMSTQIQQNQPPPRQQRGRDDQIQELRKFQQEFQLVSSNPQQNHSHQPQMNHVKTPSVSPHQPPPQPSSSPPQQQPPQQLSGIPQHSLSTVHHHQNTPQQHHSQQIQQQQQPQQQQQDNMQPMQQQKIQNHLSQQPPQQQPDQHAYSNTQVPQQQQPQSVPNNIMITSNNTPVVTNVSQQINQNIGGINSNHTPNDVSTMGEKMPPPTGVVKKTHVLNPAAKPFTPRGPSTPNPSRPHTPQTPGPAMTPSVYPAGPHVAAGQVYVMQPQPSFQAGPHPHAGAQNRLRRAAPITTAQMQVSAAAATGQPLLTAGPALQQFVHYPQQPHPPTFQSPNYQPMMRMHYEPQAQQIQFLTQTPPSTTPSPGQPHQPFHTASQPSPAGGGPPAFGPPTQPQFQVVCPMIHHPSLVQNYYQGVQSQNPHHAQQFQVIMQQQHAPQ